MRPVARHGLAGVVSATVGFAHLRSLLPGLVQKNIREYASSGFPAAAYDSFTVSTRRIIV